ncbi:MAG: hypothetical protein KBG15_24235 [Kofleriaceae bacterium]|nr:hypothetical protein [Kofleriaceae bacterium]
MASDDDDAQLLARLAKLEAEVKQDSERDRLRKEQALAAARTKRQAQLGAQQALRDRQAELMGKSTALAKRETAAEDFADDGDGAEPIASSGGGLGGLLSLAGRASQARDELAVPPKPGEKSWVKAGLGSMLLGPIGWLYAGAWRESVPAAAGWLALAYLLKILPSILLFPVLIVAMPLSGIIGAMYAVRYNRHGARQRMFTPTPPPKAKRGLKRPPHRK